MSYRDRLADSILNAAEERMQDRAQKEMESHHPRFVDWLCETYEVCDLSALVSSALVVQAIGKRCDQANETLATACERMRDDYYHWRTGLADMDELYAEIATEEDELARERQMDDAMNRATEAEHDQLRR